MRLGRSALASPLEDRKGDQMNTYIKSVSVAALMTVLPALAPHFTQAQSASPIIDCNNQSAVSKDCPPPIYKTVPAPPLVNNNSPAPSVAINTSPPLQPEVGTISPVQGQQSGWQYDPRLHRRQHHRDAVFQFSFGASSMTNHIGNIHNGTCALVASIVRREEILLPAVATIMSETSLVMG